jgi:hypothetical protein
METFSFEMAFSSAVLAVIMWSLVWSRFPFNVLLSLGNNQNSQSVISGELGAWRTTGVQFFAKKVKVKCTNFAATLLHRQIFSQNGMCRKKCWCPLEFGKQPAVAGRHIRRVRSLANHRSPVFRQEGVSEVQEFRRHSPSSSNLRSEWNVPKKHWCPLLPQYLE